MDEVGHVLWHSLNESGHIAIYDVEWPDGRVETNIPARLLEGVAQTEHGGNKDEADINELHGAHGVKGHKEDSRMNERKYKKKKLSKKQLKIAKAAPPPDEITGADFAALRKKKNETLDEYVNSLNEKKKKKKRKSGAKKASDHANYTAGRTKKSVKKLDALTKRYKNAKTKKQKMAAIKARDRFEKTQTPSGIPSKYNMSEKLNRESLRSLILEIIKDELSEKKITGKANKSLKKKAKDSNAPLGALKAIYRKGMGAFYSSGSRSGQNPHSWAMGRVNSVLKGGKARKVDAAQWKAIQKFRKNKRKK